MNVSVPMKRTLVLTFALLALLLASCTGSYEAPNPVLLITNIPRVAADGTPTNALGIIRDSLNTDQATRKGRFTFLPGSERSLPAPPQSFDITNRANARNTLVVLSRASAQAATTPLSYLSFFNIAGLDGSESDPTVAGFTNDRELSLNEAVIVPRNFPTNPIFCPSKVQVSQGGNYAAVLNVPQLCGYGPSQNFIDIFDLSGVGQARLLQRINGVAEGGLYVSQSSSDDVLYYATKTAGSLSLLRVSLPRPGQAFGPDDTLGTTFPVATIRDQLAQGNFVDFGVAGEAGGERLVALFGNALAYVTGYTGEGTSTVVGTAGSDNAVILRDDQLRTSEALVLGTPSAARLSVFPSTFTTGDGSAIESGERRARVYASTGTIEPNNGYAYFAGTGPNSAPSVSLLDLDAYSTGTTPNVQPYIEGLDGLIPAGSSWSPALLTWAQSLPPAAP